ncbi:hypothetical protein DL768_001555 [Monosporascus sp. mg162]|nr:hypothetical protein DL768_001555 [Monosporascus sp. mg162]
MGGASEDRAVALWVDALCIGQANIVEKTHQVRLMTQIYSGAAGVHSRLGNATAASTVDVEILSYLLGDGPGNIIDRTYFQRIWIMRKAALGRRVTLQVGHLSMTWESADTRLFLARIELLEISPLWSAPQSPGVDFRPL